MFQCVPKPRRIFLIRCCLQEITCEAKRTEKEDARDGIVKTEKAKPCSSVFQNIAGSLKPNRFQMPEARDATRYLHIKMCFGRNENVDNDQDFLHFSRSLVFTPLQCHDPARVSAEPEPFR